jgi:GTP cyclohydrolase II
MHELVGPFEGAEAVIPTEAWGDLRVESRVFTAAVDGDLVVTAGDAFAEPEPLVRIHSECVFGDVFFSTFCDCREQLDMAMAAILSAGTGILFYLRIDGRGAGLAAKVAATALETAGVDTFDSRVHVGVSPESREYRAIGEYLRTRGVKRIRLMTNNPEKVAQIAQSGIEVARVPLFEAAPNEAVLRLYRTKAKRFGHDIPTPDES